MSDLIEPVSGAEAAEWTRGEWLPGAGPGEIRGLTTDSRSVPPRSLFFALKGERFDAHRFVAAVAEAGAAAAAVERPLPVPAGCALLRVADTTRALGDFMAGYRRRFAPRVAAVTGTSGKTTTKNFLAAAGAERHRTVATTGNLNNHVGVPLTLAGLRRATELAVIEMGMSDRGEIARLCEIAAPAFGVITSIGAAHLERLGSVENVLAAKAELIEWLNANAGTLILNADAPEFAALSARARCRVITVGTGEDATHRLSGLAAPGFSPASFSWHGIRIELHFAGRAAVWDAALAAAAAEEMGVDRLDVVRALAATRPTAGRSQLLDLGGVRLVDDAYNANPLSYAAALEMLAAEPARRRIVVLADMLELGEAAERCHRELGERIAASGVEVLVHRGPLAAAAAAACPDVRRIACAENREMVETLDQMLMAGDLVLVKASHGMRLDEVVRELAARRQPRAAVVALGRR